MKTIWFVYPYGMLPGENTQEIRYLRFGRELSKTYNCVWWTSNYSRRLNRIRLKNEISVQENLSIKIIPTTPYNDEESEENEMAENSVLEGFEVVELKQSKGDSVLTLTSTNLKFNKATAVELGYPAFVRMLVNAATKQVAIQPCSEKTKNAVPFSKDESKQTYAVVVKVPALLTAVRKLAGSNEGDGAISFNGVLYPNERAVIFDLAKGSVPKKRHRRTKAEIEAERLNTSSTDKEEK